jgi:hypothetical protein
MGNLININYNNKVLGSLWAYYNDTIKCIVDVYMKTTLHVKLD